MNIYYDLLPVIGLSQKYRTYYKKDGEDFIADFEVPIGFTLIGDGPIAKLTEMVKAHLGIEDVNLLPSEFSEKLQAHMDDPANWPSQDDTYCDCCGRAYCD